MSRDYLRFIPPPPNFKTFFPGKYEDRLKRLGGYGKMRKSWESQKRPMLIMLDAFADDFGALEKWMDMAYRLADPDNLGQKMDFYVDDIYAAYIFNEELSFSRSDEVSAVDSSPLIYGVTSSGKVYFFGEFSGPKTPDLESLKEFCGQVIEEKVEEPICRKSQVEDVDLATWNELIYASDEDLAVCFYNAQQNGTDVNNNIMQSLNKLADWLKQEAVRLYKMDLRGGSAPKKFSVQSTPAFFFLQGAEKHKPIQCKYNLGHFTMLRFVAESASEELNYYNRRGHRKIHAELLVHMKEYFDLENDKQGYFM